MFCVQQLPRLWGASSQLCKAGCQGCCEGVWLCHPPREFAGSHWVVAMAAYQVCPLCQRRRVCIFLAFLELFTERFGWNAQLCTGTTIALAWGKRKFDKWSLCISVWDLFLWLYLQRCVGGALMAASSILHLHWRALPASRHVGWAAALQISNRSMVGAEMLAFQILPAIHGWFCCLTIHSIFQVALLRSCKYPSSSWS